VQAEDKALLAAIAYFGFLALLGALVWLAIMGGR